MEVVGLVVGIAPLASLCLEFLERARDYKDYKASSLQLNARFELARSRLKNWARTVGVADGDLIDPHHPLLDQPEVKQAVGMVLSCLLNNFGGSIEDAKVMVAQRHRQTQSAPPGWKPIQRTNTKSKLDQASRSSKNAFLWATGQKNVFTEQVDVFEILVERLHDIVPLDNTEKALKSAGEALEQVKLTQEEMFALVQRMQQDAFFQKIKSIHDWLDAPSVDQDFEKHVNERLNGTCDWLLQNKTYLAWENNNFPNDSAKLFWLCAPPGHGKTILAAMLAQRIRERKGLVACFFSSPHVQSGNPLHAIIRSWIMQLVRADDQTFETVYGRLIASNARKTTKAEVWKLFEEIIAAVDGCTLVLDGYDEFSREGEARKDFLNEIKQKVAGTMTRVLIASRPEDDIEAELLFPSSPSGLVLSGHRVVSADLEGDIALYSKNMIAEQLPKKDQQFQQELADKIASKCDGMFLWIKLQKSELRDGKSKKSLREVIDKMPDGLNQSYVRTWDDIMARSDYDRSRGVEILRWACFAVRPLTVEELTEALVHEHGTDGHCTDDMPDEIDDEYVEGEIKGLCGSFIEVRKRSGGDAEDKPANRTVNLIHTSAKEFLTKQLTDPLPAVIKSPEATEYAAHHMHLAEVCLRYLACDNSWEESDPKDDRSPFKKRFMEYAARTWATHQKEAKMMSDEYKTLTLQFFGHGSPYFGKWAKNDDFYTVAWTKRKDEDGLNARLYVAVAYDLVHVVDYLHTSGQLDFAPTTFICGTPLSMAAWREGPCFDKLLAWGADINVASGRDGSALGSAVLGGNLDNARVLLERGADTQICDWNGYSILAQACWKNNLEMMRLLLDHKVDPSDRGKDTDAPIFWSIDQKSTEGVKLLLDRGVDLTVQDSSGNSPLHYACFYDNVEILNMLLDRGLDILQMDKSGHTALHTATYRGQPKIAKALLERKPDLLASCGECDHYLKPMYCAVESGSVDTVKILIEYGGDIKQPSRYGLTCLHHACFRRYNENDGMNHDKVEVINFLLDNGLDVMSKDPTHWTPLHTAAYYARPNAAKLLLERGADINAELNGANDYRLPIHCAAQSKSVETLQALLDHGADVNNTTVESWKTPLHYACYEGSLETVKLLVERGADVSATDIDGYTTLHYACESGDLDIVNFVLERGGDLSARTVTGWTPLHSAFDSGSVQVVNRLLEKGADINQKSDRGWTAMHVACCYGSAEVVKLMIERGTDVLRSNKDGLTPLHLACWNKTADVVTMVRLLLEKGADLQQITTTDGSAAIHYACSSQNDKAKELVDLLLERGADFSQLTTTGVAPLEWAAQSGNVDTVRLLLERGAQFSKQAGPGANSWTPMHFAVTSGYAEVVGFLIEKGVLVNAKARLDQTPLQMAVTRRYDYMVEKLIDAGADVDLPLWEGVTPMEWIEDTWPKHSKLQQWQSHRKLRVTPADREIRLKQAMSDIASDALLVDKYPHRDHWPLLKHLAVHSWRLGHVDDFLFASQQTLGKKNVSGQRIHARRCKGCSQEPILGERWVCFTCPVSGAGGGVDFCGPCRTKLPDVENEKGRDCANHNLILVPCYDGPDAIDFDDDRAKVPEVKKWLETVVERHRVGEISPLKPLEQG